MPSDPDALWKPGFAGEVVFPTRVPMPAPPDRRRPVAVGVAVVVAVVAAVVAIAISRRGDAQPAAAEARVPSAVAGRWSATVPGQVWDVAASDDVVLAAAHGSQARITALRAATGVELWSRTGDLALLAVVGIIGDTALFLSSPRRGDDDLVAVDVRTGVERWRRPAPTRGSLVQVGGRHVVVTRVADGDPDRNVGADLLDLGDGSVRASVDGVDVRLGPHDVIVRDGAGIDLYDIDTFSRLTHVALPPLEALEASVVRVAGATVVVTTDDARLLGADGESVARLPLRAGDAAFSPQAVAFGDRVAVQLANGVVVIEVVDGELREVWRRTGSVIDLELDAPRPLLALATDGAAVLSGGDLPVEVLDLATGRRVWAGRVDRDALTGALLTPTGFVADFSAAGRQVASSAVIGVDPSGRTMWTHPIDPMALVVVGAGTLIEVGPTPGDATSSTVTLLR